MVKPEIECPHCKAIFPLPTRRHIFSARQKKYETPGTLCGLNLQDSKYFAKPGETVNCKVCLQRQSKLEQLDG